MIALIALGGLLVGLGVHFVPVGGAPAAMAQATGIGTGTTMLAASSGFLGLISAGLVTEEVIKGTVISYPEFVTAVVKGNILTVDSLSNTGVLAGIAIIAVAGIIGAMLMMVILAVMPNILYIFGLGVPLASAKVKKDPITGDVQYTYVTKGTEGHGTPTVATVSSLIGGLFGGLGGALIFLALLGGLLCGLIDGRNSEVDRHGRIRCSRHLLRELCAGIVQHHRHDRRLPRPEVQEVATGIRCLSDRILRARYLVAAGIVFPGGGVNNVTD